MCVNVRPTKNAQKLQLSPSLKNKSNPVTAKSPLSMNLSQMIQNRVTSGVAMSDPSCAIKHVITLHTIETRLLLQ